MNINEEKEHIYSLMRELTLERRKITEMYFSLKSRLDELHKLEQKGLKDLSLQGYVDLHNKMSKETAIKNVERESNRIVKKLESSSEIEKKKDVEMKKAVEREKEKPSNKKRTPSTEKVFSAVIEILKEHGAPMSIADLYENVIERTGYSITRKNFGQNMMYRIVNGDNKVERASRGFYQYRF